MRLVDDDREMRYAIREAAGVAGEPAEDEPWPDFAPDVGRGEILAAIRSCAGDVGRVDLVHGTTPADRTRRGPPPARAVGGDHPEAHGFVRQQLKAAVRRLTAWEIDPIIEHVNTVARDHREHERAHGPRARQL